MTLSCSRRFRLVSPCCIQHVPRRCSVKTDIDARWAISPGVRATYSEDGAVLLDIKKGVCYSLNPVASRIWLTIESCPSGITLDAIVGALGSPSGAPYLQLLADTEASLDILRQV